MKKITTKIITLVFCSLIFASAIAAQDKPVAVKIAEYNDETGNLQLLAEKAEDFARRLQTEPATTKGFVAYFRGASYLNRNQERYDAIYDFLSSFVAQNETRIDGKDGLLFGGRSRNRSNFSRAEFWMLPKDAAYPEIGLGECAFFECPRVEVKGVETVKNISAPQIFTAYVSGGSAEDYEIEYNWTVSAGEITKGQGTPVIKVDLSKVKDKEVKITLNLDGVPVECLREATFTTKISGKPELIDEFGREIFDTTQGRLDNFIAVLTNNPTAQGYVINYTGRFENKRAFAKRIEQIKTYFKFRANDTATNTYYVDTSRITFVNGGYRENLTTELWLSFDDNQKPVPTPTVDKRFVGTSAPTRKPRK